MISIAPKNPGDSWYFDLLWKFMSHFYRLYTHNRPSDKGCQIAVVDMYRPSGDDGSLPSEFWRSMELIATSPDWPSCKMLKAPLMPKGYETTVYLFKRNPGVELPDIWGWSDLLLVSERAKAVLETCDDFGHEFNETEVLDEQRQRINATPYYMMNIRRFLQIESMGGKIERQFEMFQPKGVEEDYLPTIQQVPGLKDWVANLPLWRHWLNPSYVYLSEATLARLRAAGITGLVPQAAYVGKPGESIARFE